MPLYLIFMLNLQFSEPAKPVDTVNGTQNDRGCDKNDADKSSGGQPHRWRVRRIRIDHRRRVDLNVCMAN